MSLKTKYSYYLHLSYDKDNEPDILSIIASSAALAISGMPFVNPVGHLELVLLKENMFLTPQKKN